MSAENIEEDALSKVLQELIVPDNEEIKNKNKIDVLEERTNSTNERIGSLRNELKADIAHFETELKQDIEHLSEKVDFTKSELKSDIGRLDERIDSLSEKVDLMNKFNERLFNLIHPAGQK